MIEILTLPFMQRALVAGVIIALLLSVLGVFVVARRMAFFGDGIAHASLAGIALGLLTGFAPLPIAVAYAIAIALLIYWLERATDLSSDTIIGILFTASMALGVVILSLIRLPTGAHQFSVRKHSHHPNHGHLLVALLSFVILFCCSPVSVPFCSPASTMTRPSSAHSRQDAHAHVISRARRERGARRQNSRHRPCLGAPHHPRRVEPPPQPFVPWISCRRRRLGRTHRHPWPPVLLPHQRAIGRRDHSRWHGHLLLDCTLFRALANVIIRAILLRMIKQTRFLFVIGGVMSGVGKGATTAAIGRILKSKGFVVTAMKIDPYVNVDAGTMNPLEHGEVFVTVDGDETDQTWATTSAFDIDMTRDNYMTTGRVYQSVIERERNLEYGGRCVEVVPHVPEEVILRIERARRSPRRIVLIEIGGTVGEYQNILFLEAPCSDETARRPRCARCSLAICQYHRPSAR